ncbi:hypothetical protein [Bacillus suaedae]|uniref:Uncharacterized protein n=1 Tax=Halalkalibacter suaedae TaxID=2822140 RepID=A0A940WZJ1_9BACI|nr:hypothetical protein [Bacillus suaedae]MBP3951720.1 hypothetical protein [Bacillus suaedae]
MVIKYRVRAVWMFSGVMWLVVAVLNIVVLFMSRDVDLPSFLLTLITLTIIVNLFLSLAFLSIHTIDYLRIEKGFLSVHRGFPIRRKKIKLSNVEKGRMTDGNLILYVKDQRKVELKSKSISVKEFMKLKCELSQYFSIE